MSIEKPHNQFEAPKPGASKGSRFRPDLGAEYARRQTEQGNFHSQLLKGAQLRQHGKNHESVTVLTELHRSYPDDEEVMLSLAASLRRAGDTARSLKLLNEVLASNPRNKTAALRKGSVLRQMGKTAESATLLQDLHLRHPDDPNVSFELAMSLRLKGNLDAAVKYLDLTLTQKPAHPDAPLKRAQVLRQAQRGHESVAVLKALHRDHPQDMCISLELARSYRSIQETQRCLNTLKQVLQQNPDNAPAEDLHITCLVELGDIAALEGPLEHAKMALLQSDEPGSRAQSAVRVAQILAELPHAQCKTELNACGAALLEMRSHLPSTALWRLYRKAAMLGLSDRFAGLADELLTRTSLNAPEAHEILENTFGADVENWQDICAHVGAMLSEGDANAFHLELNALLHGADTALRTRTRARQLPRSKREALIISRLLIQTGRARAAARYLSRLARVFPNDSQVVSQQAMMLLLTGDATTARQVIEAHREQRGSNPAALIGPLVALGQLEDAKRLIETLTPKSARLKFHVPYVRLLIALGEYQRAKEVIAELRQSQTQKSALHFGSSLNGIYLAELERLDASGGKAEDFSSLIHSERIISNWCKTGASGLRSAEIPKQIVQYWDTGIPPREVTQIMASWRAAEGFTYRKFSRAKASKYIAEHLGTDWAAAFARARLPAEQSDFFRLCLLMLEGGVYADADDWLQGDLNAMVEGSPGLTVFAEPYGSIANNFLIAKPKHPAIVWAAVSAKRALLERHSDSTWAKTGPGLMTRAVARHVATAQKDGEPVDVRILPHQELGKYVLYHTPLPYKRKATYWNARLLSGQLNGLSTAFKRLKQKRLGPLVET